MQKLIALISLSLAVFGINYQSATQARGPSSIENLKILTGHEIDHKLNHLYIYQMVEFKGIGRPFSSERSLAKKKLTESIISELLEHAPFHTLNRHVKVFSNQSKFKHMAVMGLLRQLNHQPSYVDVSPRDIIREIKISETTQEFAVFEQNIEHLAHLIHVGASKKLNASSDHVSKHCQTGVKVQVCKL